MQESHVVYMVLFVNKKHVVSRPSACDVDGYLGGLTPVAPLVEHDRFLLSPQMAKQTLLSVNCLFSNEELPHIPPIEPRSPV